ncbi:MAG: DUF2238 domain-containing protein, partial [Rhodospirillales bacterium]|nr:DUF2238 domain-containing protein [Rhodospirillales bacterium]
MSFGLSSRRLRVGLVAFYAAVWIIAAIDPFDRFDWFLENLLVAAFAVYLFASYRRHPLSDLSYVLITLFLTLHAIGAHYTYSEMPMGHWLKDAFEMERNHYDRVVHFTYGLLCAVPF